MGKNVGKRRLAGAGSLTGAIRLALRAGPRGSISGARRRPNHARTHLSGAELDRMHEARRARGRRSSGALQPRRGWPEWINVSSKVGQVAAIPEAAARDVIWLAT